MGELANCGRCGKVYVKTIQTICQDCYKEEEAWFKAIDRFLSKKENRAASLEEIHQETEVPVKIIQQFIRKGRLLLQHFPHLKVPCERCGETTQGGRICSACISQLKKGLAKADREQQVQRKQHPFDEPNVERPPDYRLKRILGQNDHQ
ncbi:TIGR03826 family flagellar region protein [Shouchella shacheensis]|uniref:TIGR03826 family flagellar region protein n=1 Tax=Shouchella shacheensis TaxID=1649580 RepID=UPI00073FDD09|nr:TIGR03826 family flagellar region protein [Shouchella shacheensis]